MSSGAPGGRGWEPFFVEGAVGFVAVGVLSLACCLGALVYAGLREKTSAKRMVVSVALAPAGGLDSYCTS